MFTDQPAKIPEHSIVLKKIEKIAGALENEWPNMHNPGLFGGKMGAALFFFHYARFSGLDEPFRTGEKIMQDVFDAINKGYFKPTLADGLSGISWAVDHLHSWEMISGTTVKQLRQLDEFLACSMKEMMSRKNWDWLHGATGIGFSLLQRIRHGQNLKHVHWLVENLEKLSKSGNDTVYWEMIPQKDVKEPVVNMGLAHGMPSVVYFLIQVMKQGIMTLRVKKMLEGSLSFLENIVREKSYGESVFPNWVKDRVSSGNSRLAWCYGDPGAGSVLLHAAEVLQHFDVAEAAMDVLLHSTLRRDLAPNAVLDASVCHGSAGLMHMYNRLNRKYGHQAFAGAYNHWLRVTLDFGNKRDGIAGYLYWQPEELGGWKKESGFLEGIAGIGLCLIFAISKLDPDWDEVIMLS
jgi:lantibiotic modifying enzyme